jgi:hypothetical protein
MLLVRSHKIANREHALAAHGSPYHGNPTDIVTEVATKPYLAAFAASLVSLWLRED